MFQKQNNWCIVVHKNSVTLWTNKLLYCILLVHISITPSWALAITAAATWQYFIACCFFPLSQRTNLYTENKANVIAASWGTELLEFLEALAILH